MSEYTPTTEEVRRLYVRHCSLRGRTKYPPLEELEDEFDRWLAALIREAKAEAYEQGRIDQKRSAELYARYQRGELAEVEFGRLMDTTNRRAAEYRKAVGS